ncbi:hypothetical protein ACK8HY_20620 [Sphingobacterium sp. NGMCC 1.201703]|uniref:hypothetical protein n=1 Tax=Sphingobacterium sp. NGMCC 1.201703 TaxID=3388657 RepID=UPI0039FDAB47
MMSKIFYTFLIAALLLFQNCGGRKTEKKTTEIEPTIEEVAKDSTYLKSDIDSYADSGLLSKLPVRDFPIIDSTRFESFEKYGIRDNDFLKRIKFDAGHANATNFRINYRVPFSENFGTVVISYQSGEHELFTTMITIDKHNKIIDKLDISYDEIAESAFSKTGKIEKHKITVISNNWMNEVPVFESETYILDNNGKFKKIQTDPRSQ